MAEQDNAGPARHPLNALAWSQSEREEWERINVKVALAVAAENYARIFGVAEARTELKRLMCEVEKARPRMPRGRPREITDRHVYLVGFARAFASWDEARDGPKPTEAEAIRYFIQRWPSRSAANPEEAMRKAYYRAKKAAERISTSPPSMLMKIAAHGTENPTE